MHDDELEQLFVAAHARGTGTASRLLRHGAGQIAEHYPLAWLAVVTGNDRALRFYEREGWRDAGPIDYEAEITGGMLRIRTRRYEKLLAE